MSVLCGYYRLYYINGSSKQKDYDNVIKPFSHTDTNHNEKKRSNTLKGEKRQRWYVWRYSGKLWRAEVWELVRLFILNDLANKYGTNNIGLYRDDELAIFENKTEPQAERTRKEITRRLQEHRLTITIQTNLKSVDLDITLNLTSGLFQPYRKPNDEPLYINSKSNHPPKQVHAAINRRLSASSSIKETFDKAKPLYDKALRSSGFNANLHYCEKNTTTPTKRNRKRSIIRFKPPHRKNV